MITVSSSSLFITARSGDYVLVPAFGDVSLPSEPVSPDLAAWIFEGWRNGTGDAARRAFVFSQFGSYSRSPDESGSRARLVEILAQIKRGELRMLRLRPPVLRGAPAPTLKEEPPPEPPPTRTTWFELKVVDEEGVPVSELEVAFAQEDLSEKQQTNDTGVARWTDVPASSSFGLARIVSLKQLREALSDRVGEPGTPNTPAGTRLVVGEDDLSVSIDAETPLTLVLVKPLLRVRMVGMHFETNKCFLLDPTMQGIRKIVEVYQSDPTGTLLILGHTDTTGDEEYNLELSVERAESVKAYLKDDVAAWEAWFGDSKPWQKRWGEREIDAMIGALPCTQTVAGFQQWSNDTRGTDLAVDGIAGPKTRKALIEAYMAIDGTTLPPEIDAEIHGCGEFFPRDDTGDGVEDPENRRVEMYCFHHEIVPPVPNPKATKGEPEHAEWQKQVTREIDFEVGAEEPGIRLLPPEWLGEGEFEEVEIHLVHRGAPAGECDLVVSAGGDTIVTRTGSDGSVAVRVAKDLDRVKVRFTPPRATTQVERELLFEPPPVASDEGLDQRLVNLGYPAETDRVHAVWRFQLDFGLEPTGEADAATRQKVASVYERGAG